MGILYTQRDRSTFWWLMSATYFPPYFLDMTTKFLNPENALSRESGLPSDTGLCTIGDVQF